MSRPHRARALFAAAALTASIAVPAVAGPERAADVQLPDAARSLGKSARVFKSEVNEMKEEDRQREEAKKARQVDSTATSDGDATDEAKPRTDNQSGPLS